MEAPRLSAAKTRSQACHLLRPGAVWFTVNLSKLPLPYRPFDPFVFLRPGDDR